MFRFLLLAVFLAIATSAPANDKQQYSFTINFNKLHELQDLNKIFKKLPGYNVKTVAVKDNVNAVVSVNGNLKDSVKNYLDTHNIKNSFKIDNWPHRFARDVKNSQDTLYQLNFKTNSHDLNEFLDAYEYVQGVWIKIGAFNDGMAELTVIVEGELVEFVKEFVEEKQQTYQVRKFAEELNN